MKRSEIILEARTYLSTPYHHQGRKKKVGIDCVGLVIGLCQNFNIVHQDVTGYNRHGYGADIVEEFKKWLIQVPVGNTGVGDILALWIRRPGHICHCGIISDRGMIHTHESVGRVIEHRVSDNWSDRAVTAFRFPGLED